MHSNQPWRVITLRDFASHSGSLPERRGRPVVHCELVEGLPRRAGAVWRQQVGGHLQHSRVKGQGGQVGCSRSNKIAGQGTLQQFHQGHTAALPPGPLSEEAHHMGGPGDRIQWPHGDCLALLLRAGHHLLLVLLVLVLQVVQLLSWRRHWGRLCRIGWQ